MTSRRTGNTAIIEKAFKGLDQEALNLLRQVAVRKTYPADTVLCHEGDVADTLYVIISGRAVVTRDLEGTEEDFVLGFVGEGQYFGELALITEAPRAATVTTIMETDVLEITKKDFEEVFSASPAMARSILNTMVQIIRETDKRAIEDLEKRYQELAQAYEELEAAQADRIARAALEGQLEVAAKAQHSLLPTTLPTVPGFAFAAQFEPARHIGGDLYDVELLDDGRVSVLLADVSDKGAHAALFMAVARTLFLTEEKYHSEPVEVMMAVHRGLVESTTYDMFVTALYGVLDTEQRQFRYVRGGHDEPLFVKPDGSFEFLGGKGRFLGLWADMEPVFEEQRITLESGDVLVIYSDGVTDMRNPQGDSFGREQLAQFVVSIRQYDAERIAHSIYSVVQQFRDTAEAFDDFTLLVLKAD
jgi:sigma-B regulation protein RsbU (phosphoserine phosphatase)